MSNESKDNVMSALRHSVSAIGVLLVSHGLVSNDTMVQMSGALLSVAALVWAIRSNQRKNGGK